MTSKDDSLPTPADDSLDVRQLLGRGGMAEVHLAVQTRLGRYVAVKSLRGELRGRHMSRNRLRQEAWITGKLEHPNIVPVHSLDADRDGDPLVVLKRIEGVAWNQLMRDPEAVSELTGATDLLEWNVRTLVQVCNALQFAHSQGIIHRDVKPDNVMIGRFGEVTLLDWGIAVSLREEDRGHLPLASDSKQVVGTPSFMAPEMVLAPTTVTPRTDVFLLGAVLYEIVAGRHPYRGSTEEMLGRASLAAMEWPEDAPVGLVEIGRKATSRDPEDRHASADELRVALLEFLGRRGALRLAEETRERLSKLLELMANPQGDSTIHRLQVHALYGQCRFGFAHACLDWADNPLAREGFAEATRAIAAYELERGDAEAAALFLSELQRAPRGLVTKVLRAMDRAGAEQARVADIERYRSEHDPAVGQGRRRTLVAVLCAWWIGLWVAKPAILAASPAGPEAGALWVELAMFTGVVLVMIAGRHTFTRSVYNRRTVLAALASVGMANVAGLVMWLAGQPLFVADLARQLAVVTGATLTTALFERRLWPATAGYLAAMLVGTVLPSAQHLAWLVAHLVLAVVTWIIWRQRAGGVWGALPGPSVESR